jgi:hypothetical protein
VSDDLYDLIGVEPDASTEQIRERYRERRNELEATDTDDARAESARLNRAWNVLSDPYQRGRYDAQREAATNGDDVEVLDDDEPVVAPRPRGGLFQRPPRAGGVGGAGGAAGRPPRGAPAPVVEYAGGLHSPENRKRIIAMVIDLFVLLLLFVVAQFILQSVIKDKYPDQVDRIDAISDCVNSLDTKTPKTSEVERDCVRKQRQIAVAGVDTTAADLIKNKKDNVKKLKDEIVEIQKDFTGTYYTVLGVFVAVSIVYLVVPSALSGQTLGKRTQKIKAVRDTGAPLGWGGAILRYAPLAAIGGLSLLTPLGQIVFVVLLVVVLGWMRNANRQGVHDRVAHTIVVDAS